MYTLRTSATERNYSTKSEYPIHPSHYPQYNLQKQPSVGWLLARADRFQSSFYPNRISEWNKLKPEVKLTSFPVNFRSKILSRVRHSVKVAFGVCDPIWLTHLTQLRVDLNHLNLHKFQHNFRDAPNPMCPTSDVIKDVEPFLLQCPSFGAQRWDLLVKVAELLYPLLNFTDIFNETVMQLLLHGDNESHN